MKPKGRSLERRLEVLEANSVSVADAHILQWSESVSDDELRRIAGDCASTRQARSMTDAQLWRIVRPVIHADAV